MIPCECGHDQHHGQTCWCGCTLSSPDDGGNVFEWLSLHCGDAYRWRKEPDAVPAR